MKGIIKLGTKIFLWKACKGILATRQNLSKRLKTINSECFRCGFHVESDNHILFDCNEAKDVWKQLQFLWKPNRNAAHSFKDWFIEVLEFCDLEEIEIIAITAWLLWKSRNESLFEGSARGAAHICEYGRILQQEFKASQGIRMVSISYQHLLQADNKWKPPSLGNLKINVDASFTQESGTGIGVIVRDHNGELQAVLVDFVTHCFDAEHAETMGILRALQFALENGITHAELESDALCVINKIKKSSTDLSITGHLIEDIRSMKSNFPVLSFNHVAKQNNIPAHIASK